MINAGMGLPTLMALMGHVTPEMTLRYAKLASPTIRTAYQAAIEKIRSGQALPNVAGAPAAVIPDHVQWLHAEMVKSRLAAGYCAQAPGRRRLPLCQHLRRSWVVLVTALITIK